ncbi:MAG: SNF2-related protein [Planctomycetota bacterium]
MGALATVAIWAASLTVGVLVPARVAYGLGPVGRAKRRARAVLRRLRQRVDGVAEQRQNQRAGLLEAARGYADRAAKRRLDDLPVESRRDEGVARVRWGALHDAGWRTVAEAAQAGTGALAAAPGIGDTTAARVVEAAQQVAARERGRAPEPPSPDSDEARELLDAALHEADRRARVEPLAQRMEREATPLFERIGDLGRRAGFLGWLARPQQRDQVAETLGGWSDQAETLLDVEPGPSLAEAEQALADERGQRAQGDLSAHARTRWPEVEAILDGAWADLDLTPAARAPSARGGLPEDIAERVEAQPLVAESLGVTLRRYQAFGARYLLAQERALLGDEMGLGKTIEALAALTHCWNEARVAREGPAARPAFFIVAPAGLIWNWAREIEARAPFPVQVVHGEDAEDSLIVWADEGGAAVTSYSTLRNLDVTPYLEQLGDRFEFLVADEAHFIKNPDAQRTQAVAHVLARVRRAALLSGTPMENHPEEFLQLVRLVQPAAAKRLETGGLTLDGGGGDAALFHERVAGVYLRRNQEDVLTELPERLETLEWVDLGPSETGRYRAAVEARNFAELRRATTLAEPGAVTAKLARLEELLAGYREAGRKVLVFTFFLEVLEALSERLAGDALIGTISGAVSPEGRMELVDRFTDHEGHAALLLQITAGGTGLNLQAASAVIFLEPQLKPTIEDQAVARAHRMGQTQRVLVHRLVARDTVDEHLLALLSGKRELFQAYARQSALKDASEEATETSLAARILDLESERLGIVDPDLPRAEPR